MTTPPDRSPDRITPGKALEPEKPLSQPPSTFESYMQGAGGNGQAVGAPPQSAQGPASANGLMGMGPQTAGPTFDSLLAQARNVQDGLGNVGQQLKDPNLKLKRSQTHLLKNKLQDSNEYIRAASNTLGVENEPIELPKGSSPAARFLSLIGNGQDQMNAVQLKLNEMAKSGKNIRPADMLLVQVKLSQAQQEIEYSSTLLGKVIDSIKTLMNTQL